MSALARKLAGLRQQAGMPAALAAVPAPPPAPVRPVVAATASLDDKVAQLRRLLQLRPAAARKQQGPVDRVLIGTEIGPGLHQVEHWTPWPRTDTAVSLTGLGHSVVARGDLLAFDTETTGLAGGTGTRAFMIGAADFRDGGLRVRQLYITTLAAETAMLRAFTAWLDRDTVLVSYNGKSYDRPLLSTRYRLARLKDPVLGRSHVDLLHPTRRRYKGIWANCRLATAEREVLGVVREDDLPGSQAPAAWLTYLRGGAATDLRRVAAHNLQDVRSLCGLLDALSDPV